MRIARFVLGLLAGAATLAGCSSTRLLDAVTPTGSYHLERDLAYGEHPRQRVDVYRPASGAHGTVVVFFYGGNWRGGEKADYRFIGESLSRHAITVVIPDYRVYPEIRFPTFVEDGARALNWVRDTVAADGARIFVMGHSSGAHMAALLALDPRYGQRDAVAGFVGIAGPYDFLPFGSPRTAEVFEGTMDLAQTQPISFAGPNSPPTLLFHGAEDRTVYIRNSENLTTALRRSGAPARFVPSRDRGHIDIMLGLSSMLAGDNRLKAELLDFLRQPRA